MPVVQPDQRPIRRQLARLERPARVVSDDERHTVAAEEVVDVPLEPALVAELEAVAAGRQLCEGLGQELVVTPEVGWELPDDRTELPGLHERLDPLVVALNPLADVPQPSDVGQVAARLGGE